MTTKSRLCLVGLMISTVLPASLTGCSEAARSDGKPAEQHEAIDHLREPNVQAGAEGLANSAVPAAPVPPEPPVAEKAAADALGAVAAVSEPESAPSNPMVGSEVPAVLPAESSANEIRQPAEEKSGTFRANPLRDNVRPALETVSVTSGSVPAEKTFGKGKHSGTSFDPIKENGRIFVGWDTPQLALVITGRQAGYLEPCGCAGLDRMKGGLSRRHSMFEQLRQQGWPIVGLDVGGLIKGFGRQAELKFHTTVEAMRKMGYGAIAFGKDDLQLPAAELVSVAASVDSQQSPFISANVGLFGFESGMTSQAQILEAGGRKLGVTAVLGEEYQAQVNNAEVAIANTSEALAKVVPALKEQADLLILLAHATKEESVEYAKQFPDFDVVVTAGGPPEPPRKAATVEGTNTLLIEVGEKGMQAIVLGFFKNPRNPIRYQRVPLDSRFPNSLDMKLLMAAYQDQLKTLGLAGLGIREVPHPQKELNGEFAGSEECRDCHKPSHKIWKESGHAKAWQTLVELDPPRNFDPECISCHVVGWNSQRYFPYESGFLDEYETPHLIDVGCESCHGPGLAHVDAELESSDEELKKKLQEAMVITKEQSEKWQCVTCHDLDNSPDFNFEEYWPQVEHYEEQEDQSNKEQ